MKGVEQLFVLFSNKRKYYCLDCGLGFRAPDRRGTSRDIGDAYSSARAAGILR
jgi:hypothetical protein